MLRRDCICAKKLTINLKDNWTRFCCVQASSGDCQKLALAVWISAIQNMLPRSEISIEPCTMCLAASYWAGIEKIFYAASVEDAFEYGNFDDRPIYEQLALPKEQRSIKLTQLLRDEAIVVWKQYQAKPDKTHY